MNPRPRPYYGTQRNERLIQALAVLGLTVFFIGICAVMYVAVLVAGALAGAVQ